VLTHRYRTLWDLDRVLYQRFRYIDGQPGAEEVSLDALQEEAAALNIKFEATTSYVPRTSETRNTQLETRSPKPETGTRNPEPGTRNQEPGTRNQEPGTRNPEPDPRNLNPETQRLLTYQRFC